MAQTSTNQLLTQVTPTYSYSPSSWLSKTSCQIQPNILPLVIQLSMINLFLLNPTNIPPWASSLITTWSVLLSQSPLILIFQASISLSISCTFLIAIQSPRHVQLFATTPPHRLQHARLPCASPHPKVCLSSCPLNWWCHPIISSSVIFSFCLQPFPAPESFPMNHCLHSCTLFIPICKTLLILPLYGMLLSLSQFNSVTQSCPTLCDPMDCSMPGFPVHYLTPGACSKSCSSSWWCHPTSSSSAIPFSSCLQSFPASGSFPMNQLFKSGGQSIGASVSSSVFSKNIQDWFPLGLTVLISLQSKGLSRVFSSTIVLLSLLSPFCLTRF